MSLFFLLRPYHWFRLNSTDADVYKKHFEGPIKGPYKRKKALEKLKKTLFNNLHDIVEAPQTPTDIPAIIETSVNAVKDYTLELAFLDELIRVANKNKEIKDARIALEKAITAEIRQELIKIEWQRQEQKRLELIRIEEERLRQIELRKLQDEKDIMALFSLGII